MALVSVPGANRGLIMTTPFLAEPHDDQAVEQHGYRRGPLDRLAAPALRLFKAQVDLAVMKRHLDAPPQGVPAEDLLRQGLVTGAVERLTTPTAREGLDRHHPQQPPRHGEDTRLAIGHAHLIAAAVDVEGQTGRTVVEHPLGRCQLTSTLARRSLLSWLARPRQFVEPCVEHQPTGQVTVWRQLPQHALSAI